MDYLLKTPGVILKGKNRWRFEKILKENIKKKIGPNLEFIKNLGGVFWLSTKKEAQSDLEKIFGIAVILKVKIFSTLEEVWQNFPQQIKDFNLIVKRGDKNYPFNSQEIFRKTVTYLKENYKLEFNKKSLHNFYLEYRQGKFFLADKKIVGLGGLPVSSSGSGIALLSAGFDSPVASFLAMKRGLKIHFIHFHSYPQTSKDSLEKVEKLVKILNEYNLGSQLYLLNILKIQKFYYQNIPKEFLVIFYRRTMLRLAEKLKSELKADCLVTGESLGQVASQTIQNLKVISQAINSFILRPLIGFDKQEIINLAQKIGTEKISRFKGDDCCSLFVPKKVKTKTKIEEVLKIENKWQKEIANLEKEIYEERSFLKI